MNSLIKLHFHGFAGYNAWANARLYESVANLSDAEYRADRGAFFKSVHGTLNHLLATDRVWLQRLSGTGDAPDRLDAILFEDFASLRNARREDDARIVAYVSSLNDAALAGMVSYRRVSTLEMQRQAIALALAHWFNHQTHHRAQVHTLLSQLTAHAPELDLLFYQRFAGGE